MSRPVAKVLSILLSVVLVLSSTPAQAIAEMAEEASVATTREMGTEAVGSPASAGDEALAENEPLEEEQAVVGGQTGEGVSALGEQELQTPAEDAALAPQSDGPVLSAQSLSLRNPRVVANSSMSSGQVTTWDCVWFGSYPQTEVKPGDAAYNMLAAAGVSWDANGDATVGGARYRRISKDDVTNDQSWFAEWDAEGYDPVEYRYFTYEPIKWRVLEASGSRALVVSDVALDDQCYNDANAEWDVYVTWESSTIRSWLNGYDASANGLGTSYADKNFADTAFSAVENGVIATTSVVNDSSAFGADGGNDTVDNIFLLSESDVSGSAGAEHGFINDARVQDATRCCRMSDYARAMGAYWDDSAKPYGVRYCDWWLRSPGAAYIKTWYHHLTAGYVRCDGWVDGWDGSYPHDINSNDVAVRPALNLNLSSPLIQPAGTVSSDGSSDEQGATSDPAAHTVSAQFFVNQADVGRQDVDVEFEWDMGAMLPGGDAASRGFDVGLAVPSLVLSGAVEQEQSHEWGRTKSILSDMGFDVTQDYNFGEQNDVNWPAFVCGYKALDVGGTHKNVFAVVVRGTSSLEDAITDLAATHDGFRRAAANTKSDLEQKFMTRSDVGGALSELRANRESNIFLLCGHSLGGAVVNHLALDLSEYATDDNVYAYAFAAPRMTDQRDARGNIHNLVSEADWVPMDYSTGQERNGKDVWLVPSWDDDDFTGAFKSLTGKDWQTQSLFLSNSLAGMSIEGLLAMYAAPYTRNVALYLANRVFNNHVAEVYMARLMSWNSYAEHGSTSEGSFTRWRLVCARCPVDMEVWLGDEVVGRVAGNEVDPSLGGIVPMRVDGDDKYAMLPADIPFEVRLVGTDAGTMDYSVTEIEGGTDEVVGEKSFANVALEEGKRFSSEVAATNDDASSGEAAAPAEAVEGTQLLVLGEDGRAELSVDSEGREKTYIGRAEVSAIPDAAYTGNAVEPAPKLTFEGRELVRGTDYDVAYRSNVGAGTASAVISGMGEFGGAVTAAFRIVAKTFPDVPAGAWYADIVSRAVGLGLLSGYSNGKFGPADKITRGQVAVILWNMAGNPAVGSGAKTFTDVGSGDYYYNAVRWASSKGVVSGYGNGKFGPKDNVTREQLAVMLANFAKNEKGKAVSGSKSDFASMADKDKVSSWAVSSVGWCFKNNILSGSGGNVNPAGSASRAEAAKMVVVLHDLFA